MLGFLSRFRKKSEDIGDIRSHILGEQRFNEPPPSRFDEPMPLKDEGFDRPFNEPMPRYDRQPVGIDAPFEIEKPSEKSNYEVLDRLNFIENQLSAIKSQVELVNERLKNMEMKLGTRRY